MKNEFHTVYAVTVPISERNSKVCNSGSVTLLADYLVKCVLLLRILTTLPLTTASAQTERVIFKIDKNISTCQLVLQ